jgi:Lrp/AsnC family transcriptional regulator for asnA, asnC and gidA
LDDLDLKILERLRENARIPLLQLSRDLGVSDVTVHTRIEQMQESGVIKGYKSIVNYELLGLPIVAFIQLKISQGKADEVIDFLKRVLWVSEVYDINGEYELLIKIRAKDTSDLRDKVESELSKEGHIVEKNVMIVLRTEKEIDESPLIGSVGFKGKSGVMHKFTDATRRRAKVQKVIDVYNSKATEVEILKAFAKAIDVGAREVEIVAPSYTKNAQRLARQYKMKLKTKEENA